MQSIRVSGAPNGRAKNGKHLRELIASDSSRVSLEATSIFGNEYDGPIDFAPAGKYPVVLPHPYDRRYYPLLIVEVDEHGKRSFKVK